MVKEEQVNNVEKDPLVELFKKIEKVQDALEPFKMDGKNPHFRSKYVTLNSILRVLKPALSENGLILVFQIVPLNTGKPGLKMTISDRETGASDGSIYQIDATEPQKKGAEITYGRRFLLDAYFNLEREDDDGNLASGKTTPKKATTKSTSTSRDF